MNFQATDLNNQSIRNICSKNSQLSCILTQRGRWQDLCSNLLFLASVRGGQQGILRKATTGQPSVSHTDADTSYHSGLWFTPTRGKLGLGVHPFHSTLALGFTMTTKSHQFSVGFNAGVWGDHGVPQISFFQAILKSGKQGNFCEDEQTLQALSDPT